MFLLDPCKTEYYRKTSIKKINTAVSLEHVMHSNVIFNCLCITRMKVESVYYDILEKILALKLVTE